MAGKIIIESTPEGKTTIRVEGVKGNACKAFSKDFEAALGIVRSDTPTKEMNEKPLKIQQKVRQ